MVFSSDINKFRTEMIGVLSGDSSRVMLKDSGNVLEITHNHTDQVFEFYMWPKDEWRIECGFVYGSENYNSFSGMFEE